jgi:hypothetical protein
MRAPAAFAAFCLLAASLPASASDGPSGEFGDGVRVPRFEKSPAPGAPLPSPARGERVAAAVGRRFLRPALYARHAKGPDGYDVDHLAEDLRHTAENLDNLLDYLRPFEGGAPPAAEDAAWARGALAQEVVAAERLTPEGVLALERGIARVPPPPAGDKLPLRRLILHVSRAVPAHRDPTPEQRLETNAGLHYNVIGHMGALIALKRLNPPQTEHEALTEGWLRGAREEFASHAGPLPATR